MWRYIRRLTDECTWVTDIFQIFIAAHYLSLPARHTFHFDSVSIFLFHTATVASAPNVATHARAGLPSALSSPSPAGPNHCRPSCHSTLRRPRARCYHPHPRLLLARPAQPAPSAVVPIHGLHGPDTRRRGSRTPPAPYSHKPPPLPPHPMKV
jgi:hypothetical protein